MLGTFMDFREAFRASVSFWVSWHCVLPLGVCVGGVCAHICVWMGEYNVNPILSDTNNHSCFQTENESPEGHKRSLSLLSLHLVSLLFAVAAQGILFKHFIPTSFWLPCNINVRKEEIPCHQSSLHLSFSASSPLLDSILHLYSSQGSSF